MPRYYVAFVHAIPYYRCNDTAGQFRGENPWRRRTKGAEALRRHFDIDVFTRYIETNFPTSNISLEVAKATFDELAARFLLTVPSPVPNTTIDLESDDPSGVNIYRKIGSQHIGGPMLVLRDMAGDQVGLLEVQVVSTSGPVPAYIHIMYGLTDIAPSPLTRKAPSKKRKK